MRRPVTAVAAGMLLAVIGASDRAWSQSRPDDFRRSAGNLRPDSRTAGGAIQGSDRPRPTHVLPEPGGHGDPWSRGHGNPADRWRPDYGCDLFVPNGYSYFAPYYPPSYWVSPYLPPFYLPAETIYGPAAVQRFIGILPNGPPAPVDAISLPDDKQDEKPALLRGTNAEAVALGRKFIGFGDAQFVEQQFAQAYLRYKKAAQSAPRLAEAYFRQGWALVASGRYELAAAAFKKGLDLDPDWPGCDFRLDEIYGPNRMAKTAHIDALAAAAADEPQNADLLFLVGVFLFFDGQPHRARPFFERSAQLARGVGAPVGGFLAEVREREL